MSRCLRKFREMLLSRREEICLWLEHTSSQLRGDGASGSQLGAGWTPRWERGPGGKMEKDCSAATGSGVLRAFARFPSCFLMDSLIRGSPAFLIEALLSPARSSFLTQSASSRRQTSSQPRLDFRSLERKCY